MRIWREILADAAPDREGLAHRRVRLGGVQIIAEIGLDAPRQRQRGRNARLVGSRCGVAQSAIAGTSGSSGEG